MPAREVKPVVWDGIQNLCRWPYHGHPKGCPNWDRKRGCPPRVPLLDKVLNLRKPVYCVWSAFNIRAHMDKLGGKHPYWSDRQLRNCLYWQGGARRRLKNEVLVFLTGHLGLQIVYCPEAHGVDVTATMDKVGIRLEWPPKRLAYQVALVGTSMKRSR